MFTSINSTCKSMRHQFLEHLQKMPTATTSKIRATLSGPPKHSHLTLPTSSVSSSRQALCTRTDPSMLLSVRVLIKSPTEIKSSNTLQSCRVALSSRSTKLLGTLRPVSSTFSSLTRQCSSSTCSRSCPVNSPTQSPVLTTLNSESRSSISPTTKRTRFKDGSSAPAVTAHGTQLNTPSSSVIGAHSRLKAPVIPLSIPRRRTGSEKISTMT